MKRTTNYTTQSQKLGEEGDLNVPQQKSCQRFLLKSGDTSRPLIKHRGINKATLLSNAIGWIYSAFTVALLIGGFFAPPLGIIDNSVLTACGILFGFAALDKMPELIKKGQSAEVVTKNGTRIAVGSRSENKKNNLKNN